MAEAIIPLDYFDTNMLCRWRFLLEENVESDKDLDTIITNALSGRPEGEDREVIVLTRISGNTHILSKVRVLGTIRALSVGTYPFELYGDGNYDYPLLYRTLSKIAVDGALAAIVLGGIEDARRGLNYPKKYRDYLSATIPEGYRMHVNSWPYMNFDAASFLLAAIMSVRLYSYGGRRHIFDDEDEFDAPCSTCPFAEHCGVSLEGGLIWKRSEEISYAVSGAMYADRKWGNGWYLLYRTAVRLLGYKSYNLKRAFMAEMKNLYGEVVPMGDMRDVREIMTVIEKNEHLSEVELNLLRSYAEDFVTGVETFVETDIFLDTPENNSLARKGFIVLTRRKDEGSIPFFRINPGPRFMKYLWGGEDGR